MDRGASRAEKKARCLVNDSDAEQIEAVGIALCTSVEVARAYVDKYEWGEERLPPILHAILDKV